MTNIGYMDLVEKKLRVFTVAGRVDKWSRIVTALSELENMGNVAIYLVYGNKRRLLSIHRM